MRRQSNIPTPLFYPRDDVPERGPATSCIRTAYLDTDFNYISVNEYFADLSGQSPENHIGLNYFDTCPHEGDRDIFCTVVETKEPYHIPARPFQCVDIPRYADTYWDWLILPIMDHRGVVTSLIVTLVDVTERVHTNEMVEYYIRELERSNTELEEFASVASHDLHEPLRKILTFGDLVKGKCGDSFPPDAADYLERMLRAAQRMRTLIESLLNYSRITIKKKPFQQVDLGATVREAVLNLHTLTNQKNARIEIEDLPVIEADPQQMLQLMQNLIANSLKFQKEGNIPHIKIWSTASHGVTLDDAGESSPKDLCQIMVKDNGIGFEKRHLDRIFGTFQRLHGKGSYEGVGIGLAICRKIAERHGGDITAVSAPGEGSTFIVRLPFTQEESGEGKWTQENIP